MLFSLAHFSFCHVTVLGEKKLGFFSVNRRCESNFAYSTGIKQITLKFLQERWFQSVGAAYLT